MNRISICLSLSVLTGGWKVVALFSQGVVRAHPVLLLNHFLKSILVQADPLSHRNSLFKSLWVLPHLCLPGHNSDFCKCLSTSGTEVKLSGEFADAAVGRAFRKFCFSPY